jgi:hypothetical protein
MARTCKGCGGILGRDCWNEMDCLIISNRQQNQDSQYINQLETDLNWSQKVVIPDLEDRLNTAITLMYNLSLIVNKSTTDKSEIEYVEKVLIFYNEVKHYKKTEIIDYSGLDDLPF